mmetsp:Transcript_33354/g.53845  ORF Transcript_33354/g.53845 Transcript_33354/m.53845 type:complete len:313 (-) Transcript_33354:176-1114(-)
MISWELLVALIVVAIATFGLVLYEKHRALTNTDRPDQSCETSSKSPGDRQTPESAVPADKQSVETVERKGVRESYEELHQAPAVCTEKTSGKPVEGPLVQSVPVEERNKVDCRTETSEMADDLDLDDILDDAFDEMDMLDEAADDLLLEEAANEATSTTKAVATSKVPMQQPKTWQETLSILEPTEKLEWLKTISKDMGIQSKELPQPSFSFAYQGDQAQGGGSDALSTFLETGSKQVETFQPDDMLEDCLAKALYKVNKQGLDNVNISSNLRKSFRNQLTKDSRDLISCHPAELENVKSEPERFKNCLRVL